MKKYRLIIIAFVALVSLFGERTFAQDKKEIKPVSLTLMSENGSVVQRVDDDGELYILIRKVDLVRVNTILLNGEDVTSKLIDNKLTLPELSHDSTLEVYFDQVTYSTPPVYQTIASN